MITRICESVVAEHHQICTVLYYHPRTASRDGRYGVNIITRNQLGPAVTEKMVFATNRYTWSLWCQKKVHSKTKYKSHAGSPAMGQS